MAIITGTAGNDTVTTSTSSFGPLTTSGNDSVDALGGNDSIQGGGGLDTLVGGTGNDVLYGGNDNDSLLGGDGDDELYGGGGNDVIDGGAGFDLVSFNASGTDGSVVVTVTNVGGVNTGISTTSSVTQGSDTFTNFEQINGSSANDTITVVSANTVLGFQVRGNAGNDVLIGTAVANNSLFLDYRSGSVTSGVSVDLALGRAADGLGGIDTISNFIAVRGSSLGDTLLGGSAGERFRGRAGSDYIDGRNGTDIADYTQSTAGVSVNLAIGRAQDGEGGTDTLLGIEDVWGSAANDTLVGSSMDESFAGFTGNDTIDGGGGQDRVAYNFTAGNVNATPATQGVIVNLVTGTATDAWGGTDKLIGIERVTGTAFADSMLGGAESNRFRGRAGNDTMDGGLGGDTAEYQNATASVTANLTTGIATDGEGGTDRLVSFENVIGGASADRLTGVAQLGRTTSDLRGGGGNDTLVGISGEFVRADYADQTIGLSINLGSGSAADGRGGIDTFINIRGVTMFGDFADTLIGTAFGEWFSPSDGADSVNAGTGFDIIAYGGTDAGGVSVNLFTGRARDTGGSVDTILGFEGIAASFGDDLLTGNGVANLIGPGAGADSVNAGGGEDTISYSLGFSPDGIQFTANEAGDRLPVQGVTIDLFTSRATDYGGSVDTIIGFEHAIGSTAGDIIRGNGLANILAGAEGNDTIDGRAGNDTLDGGTGNDRMLGSLGDDTFIVDAAQDVVVEALNQGIDTVRTNLATYVLGGNIENLVATGAINRRFTGNVLDNAITGGAGVDTIVGGAGNDTIDGGAGVDRLFGSTGDDLFIITPGDVVVEALNAGHDTVQAASGATALAANLEDLVLTGSATNGIGNTLANVIIGNDLGNILNGGVGDDTLDGSGGVDYLIGGAGQDALIGGAGNDHFRLLSVTDSTVAAPDIIFDFNHSTELDRIELNLIDANGTLPGDPAFVYRGAAFTGAAGDLRVESLGSDFYLAAGDVNGDGDPDFAIVIQSSTGPEATWFAL